MIFAIDDRTKPITTKSVPAMGSVNNYNLIGVNQVDEAEMFRIFKKSKNILESKWRIENQDTIDMNFDDDKIEYRHIFPFTGAYIIPKMFGYFPFLDCDDINTYTEAKFQLSANDIPYATYRSSNVAGRFWIFCDRQGTLDEAINFIESYPCDHRYPWLARYKQELCVRAIPKNNCIPKYDESHLPDEFSDDFKYWNKQFRKYWNEGSIPSYIDMINTVNAI